MKKLLLAVIAVVGMSACETPLFNAPIIPVGSEAEIRSNAAPGNITATHGGKGSIDLSWDEVPGAARYNIFRAESPLMPFAQCGETTDTQFKASVPAGSTVFYRVSAVSSNGQESPHSLYVMGSSLAQPIITDITDVTESSATVTWYMENVSDDTYKAHLRYTVYCFSGPTEVAQIALDGKALAENKASFRGLNASTSYEYQVEAYLASDQSSSEKSYVRDKKTLHRFLPGAPGKLAASRGTSKDTVELSFELPEKVKVSLGANEYEDTGIYFVISKRVRGEGDYMKVCSRFGSEQGFDSYEFGKTVTWTDPTESIRGVEYEYLVQSYVDGIKEMITSDDAKATGTGWTLAEGKLSIGEPVYTLNEDESLYVSAKVPLAFNFDPKGETYRYKVLETINPIEDEYDYDPDVEIKRESVFLSDKQITGYASVMSLTQKTTSSSPGRGKYSYAVSIHLPDGTAIDTVAAIGDKTVSEDVAPIVARGFAVQDGYTDRFRVKWDSDPNTRYVLYKSTDGNTWTEARSYSSLAEETAVPRTEELAGYTPGTTVYFALQPIRGNPEKKGQWAYLAEGCQTLGVPVCQPVNVNSYSTITAVWGEAQKADTYRVKYKYAADGNWITVKTLSGSELSPDVTGTLRYSFKPDGYNDITKSGKAIQVKVDALNEGLRKQAGGGEIVTTSAEVEARLVGPAELAPEAKKAVSAEYIEVSWNKVSGADGYYVYRRQFNMNDTAEEGAETVVYYIPASASSITGKDLTLDASNIKKDTDEVKAQASLAGSRYTLKDIYMSDDDYKGKYGGYNKAYRDQQNELAWGFPYHYFIVPVLGSDPFSSNELTVEFNYAKDPNNKNTAVNAYTLGKSGESISYSGAAALEKTGSAIGFGQNVTATKGTYASSGNVNNGIRIKWSRPSHLDGLAGFNPQYTIYRKAYGSLTWETVNTAVNATQYDETSLTRGIAYEYVVGVSNSLPQPKDFSRFITLCGNLRDDRDMPNYLGYMLGYVRMTSVTRGEDSALNAVLGERVIWQSTGIQSNFSTGYNWGIDGYSVYVMNRNISNGWHLIADDIASVPQVNQSIVLTPSNTPSVTVTDSIGTVTRNLLFVLRDYKHFYRVRTYIQVGDTKIYGPDHPEWSYQYRFGTNQSDHINASNAMENDYVKWGARQINKDEFIRIAALYFARGQDRVQTTSGSWASEAKSGNASATWGGSGSLSIGHNYLIIPAGSVREHNFSNYKDDMQARCGQWMTFVTLNGKANGYNIPLPRCPQTYWENGWVTVTGPWDVSGLYNGQIKFGTGGRGDNTNIKWDNSSGRVVVKYPTAEAEQTFNLRGNDTPFAFQSGTVSDQSSRLNNNNWR